jgi:malto-oligosyltrehalose trehalohydrolase
MPFGAQVSPAGTRFRLWAPAACQIDLELVVGEIRRELAMTPLPEGWFGVDQVDAPMGARYSFRIDGGRGVPDPASRYNPDDVHASSMVVDPLVFEWSVADWTGRPWEEAIIYELHVGAFTTEGTFSAAAERLDYLVQLGVTAVELMPLADFPGRRGWGYDGVLPFAPDASYGGVADLKGLIDAAHARGLMMLLDVVYNHFGPEGNYLGMYAPQFFNPGHRTPWGAAVNFDGEQSRTVRDFFIHNALYWLEEYAFDGLRLDAVDRIVDDSSPELISELAEEVRQGPGAQRHVHIVLENDRNEARYLGRDAQHRPLHATAQWNDDLHHALHVVLTGETDGYYADFATAPLKLTGRCLAEGFAYQGEPSPFRGGALRGEPSVHLPLSAFVSFLQTHDQVGNRALGERIAQLADPRALRAAVACVLLAPSPPLLFMGEEFAASTPFFFFCDFGPDLAQAVTQGRMREFTRFARFRDPAAQKLIPDPNDPATFERSRLDWQELRLAPHDEWLAFYQQCLHLRSKHLVPRLAGMVPSGSFAVEREEVLLAHWTLGDQSALHLIANFGATRPHPVELPAGKIIFATEGRQGDRQEYMLEPYSVLCLLA